jgi:ribonuclease P protein component
MLSLKYVLNEKRSVYRASVVVSKKVSKSAVKRNRIRRRIYESIRENNDAITKPYDLVFIVYGEQLATIKAAEIHEIVAGQLKKAGVLISKRA